MENAYYGLDLLYGPLSELFVLTQGLLIDRRPMTLRIPTKWKISILSGKILVGSVSSHGSLRSHRSHGSLRSHRSHGSLRSHGSHRCIMGLPVQQVFWVS